MWRELLTANVTEAIGEKKVVGAAPPSLDYVQAFLTAAESAPKSERALNASVRLVTRDGDSSQYAETQRADGGWVHAYRGQSAKAFIALKPGHPQFGIDELRAFLADKLAKYEMPTEMEIRASLPKTPVGKLSKKELLAEEIAKRQASDALPAGVSEVA
jgi:acyl-CoA synthetase (AMP-forming)/AMP-acid ligase II